MWLDFSCTCLVCFSVTFSYGDKMTRWLVEMYFVFLGLGHMICPQSLFCFSSVLLLLCLFRAAVFTVSCHSCRILFFKWNLPVHRREKNRVVVVECKGEGCGLWPGILAAAWPLPTLRENSLEQICKLLFPKTETDFINSEFTGWNVICFLKVNHLFCNKGPCYLVDKRSCCVSFI